MSVDSESCVKREYDEVFMDFTWSITDKDTADFEDLSDSVLLIIDVQKDFTYGSFGEPCYETTPSLNSLPGNLATTAKRFANRGAFIVASKDYHPDNHCSFYTTSEQCLNNFTKYPDYQGYQNSFPPHCMFNHSSGSVMQSTEGDFIGADLHEELAPAMQDLMENGQGAIVFKAFNEEWESFSAFEFIDRYSRQWNFTGGWATPDSMMEITPGVSIDSIYPTKAEHESYPEGWTSLSSLLMSKGIRRAFVTGLVFDYCVKDTSIYSFVNLGGENPWESKEGAYNYTKIQTFVITDLARPAADGGQNLGIGSYDFILGTAEKTVSAAGDMLRSGVRFVRSSDIFCSAIPNCAECEDDFITCSTCEDGLTVMMNGSCGTDTMHSAMCSNSSSDWSLILGTALVVSIISVILSSCVTYHVVGRKKYYHETSVVETLSL